MQELMNMNYGGQNQNRGFGGAPQPQRANNRRSRGGMGPGGFRGNSRFEHNQQSGSPQPQQNNRSVEAKPDLVENKIAVQSPANKAPVAAVPTAAPKTVSEPVQKPPVQNQAPPAQAAKPPQTQETAAAPENHNLNNSGADNRGAGQEHRGPPPNNRGPVNAGPENQNNQLNNKKRQNSFGGPGNKPAGNFGGPGNKGSGNFGGQGGNFGGQGGNFGGQGGNFGGQGNFGSQGNFGGQGKTGGGPGGPPRNQRGPRGGPDNKMGGGPQHAAREEHMLASKLKELAGPLTELVPLEQSEVKFNGRSRLYIGNLSQDITEQEIQEMFGQFGETSELFLNKEKNFAFIRMDFRANAEKAKRELDGTVRRGRSLRVRFAPHNSAVRVRNLTPFVSNELLYRAFEIFGKIERAYVKVDERGKSLSEGVVEFARKASALAALRNCTEKCFFLTSSLRPVIVENFEEPDEFDGYQEKNLPKKHPDFLRAREAGPRFSEANSFEHEYGTRWKQLHELYRQKEEALKAERSNEEDKLDAQMEFAKYEHETELLREQLRQREQDRERQKRTWEIAERAAEERREAERLSLARQEEDLASRMRVQDDELRRRQQENTLFVQAQRLNSMLDRQEQGMFDTHPQQQNMIHVPG